MEAFMDKSTQSIAANKKVTIAELDGVKPLLMPALTTMTIIMVMTMAQRKKVTAITITVSTICICGYPQR
jgi:ABC-type Zn2+ transport system substrate-binding protein/surface adhesin